MKHTNISVLERFARKMTDWAGSTAAFIVASLIITVWLVTGKLFDYSDTWQLVINTGTTIVTFLMVFLIQRTQNKDSLALHIKLNELIAAQQGASNRLLNIEELGEDELRHLHRFYSQLFEMTRNDHDIGASHSVEEAERRHQWKLAHRKDLRESHKPAGAPASH